MSSLSMTAQYDWPYEENAMKPVSEMTVNVRDLGNDIWYYIEMKIYFKYEAWRNEMIWRTTAENIQSSCLWVIRWYLEGGHVVYADDGVFKFIVR